MSRGVYMGSPPGPDDIPVMGSPGIIRCGGGCAGACSRPTTGIAFSAASAAAKDDPPCDE
eukprot:CAMPEP_0177789198 /NCGR_PEP_ID=MMETSP0491_2-20121128/22599_1 /TAXON_ID=63592 /ORGANISM="Tetraselmis chuii, Strain PLY429" /LENGTH=59 /DNA_ID=CAMNT_0019311001 /DNA_START=358 /DNA_END=537 /DNA_ORIENTATION=-